MGSLKRRMRSAEKKAGPLTETLRLRDGTEITYRMHEKTEAFLAFLGGEDHWLVPYLREAQGKIGELVRALAGDEGDDGDKEEEPSYPRP